MSDELESLREENRRLREFAFGDAPKWEKANATLKHRVRELEAEVAEARAETERLEWLAARGADLALELRETAPDWAVVLIDGLRADVERALAPPVEDQPDD